MVEGILGWVFGELRCFSPPGNSLFNTRLTSLIVFDSLAVWRLYHVFGWLLPRRPGKYTRIIYKADNVRLKQDSLASFIETKARNMEVTEAEKWPRNSLAFCELLPHIYSSVNNQASGQFTPLQFATYVIIIVFSIKVIVWSYCRLPICRHWATPAIVVLHHFTNWFLSWKKSWTCMKFTIAPCLLLSSARYALCVGKVYCTFTRV